MTNNNQFLGSIKPDVDLVEQKYSEKPRPSGFTSLGNGPMRIQNPYEIIHLFKSLFSIFAGTILGQITLLRTYAISYNFLHEFLCLYLILLHSHLNKLQH
jgi:hypothetical protein